MSGGPLPQPAQDFIEQLLPEIAGAPAGHGSQSGAVWVIAIGRNLRGRHQHFDCIKLVLRPGIGKGKKQADLSLHSAVLLTILVTGGLPLL